VQSDASGEGRVGRGLTFGGGVLHVTGSATSTPLDITGPLTLSAWVRPNGQGTVLAKRSGSVSQYQLQLENCSGGPCPSLIWSNASDAQCIFGTTAPITTGAWHHVAVAVDATGQPERFVVDGMSVAFGAWNGCSGTPQHRDFDVAIGARWAGTPPATGFALSGMLDEVRVESVARSQAWLEAQHASMIGSFATLDAPQAR
jgi:hypothetical protein